MKATYLQLAAALALTSGIAACSPAAKNGVTALPLPPEVLDDFVFEPAPALPAAPEGEDWMDAVLTPGGWHYEKGPGNGSSTFAHFGTARSERRFTMQCRGSQIIFVAKSDTPTRKRRLMRITSETLSRTFEAYGYGGKYTGSLLANDPVLDAMALSKGRFAVEVAGEPPLYLPSWAEVSRVIEDCR